MCQARGDTEKVREKDFFLSYSKREYLLQVSGVLLLWQMLSLVSSLKSKLNSESFPKLEAEGKSWHFDKEGDGEPGRIPSLLLTHCVTGVSHFRRSLLLMSSLLCRE